MTVKRLKKRGFKKWVYNGAIKYRIKLGGGLSVVTSMVDDNNEVGGYQFYDKNNDTFSSASYIL